MASGWWQGRGRRRSSAQSSKLATGWVRRTMSASRARGAAPFLNPGRAEGKPQDAAMVRLSPEAFSRGVFASGRETLTQRENWLSPPHPERPIWFPGDDGSAIPRADPARGPARGTCKVYARRAARYETASDPRIIVCRYRATSKIRTYDELRRLVQDDGTVGRPDGSTHSRIRVASSRYVGRAVSGNVHKGAALKD